jgi:hypothetical protein
MRYTLPVGWAWASSDPSRMPRVMMKPIPLTVMSASSRLSLLRMSLHRSNCAATRTMTCGVPEQR